MSEGKCSVLGSSLVDHAAARPTAWAWWVAVGQAGKGRPYCITVATSAWAVSSLCSASSTRRPKNFCPLLGSNPLSKCLCSKHTSRLHNDTSHPHPHPHPHLCSFYSWTLSWNGVLCCQGSGSSFLSSETELFIEQLKLIGGWGSDVVWRKAGLGLAILID